MVKHPCNFKTTIIKTFPHAINIIAFTFFYTLRHAIFKYFFKSFIINYLLIILLLVNPSPVNWSWGIGIE